MNLPLLQRSLPRALVGRVKNSTAALPAMPVPANRERVRAFTPASAIERWNNDAAGLRALEGGDNVITMFDVIGEDFWSGGGVTAKNVARQLRAIGGPVEVQINSPGGDVFEGFAIYNLLREHPYNVNVKVIGMAASAASVIAMAGDNIKIGTASFIMIHNTWCIGVGNRHDFRELADFLEPFDAALANVYEARTGKDRNQIVKWLDAETYMSGQTAIDNGFADELLGSDQVTEDESIAAKDRSTNEIRALELSLLASGLTRTQARERIQRIKGKPDAADGPKNDGKPDAATNFLRSVLAAAQAHLPQESLS